MPLFNALKTRKMPRIKKKPTLSFADLKNEIAERSALSSGDVLACLEELEKIIAHKLQEGTDVEISFGKFAVSVKLNGEKKVSFRPKKSFEQAVSEGFHGEIINARNIGKDFNSL